MIKKITYSFPKPIEAFEVIGHDDTLNEFRSAWRQKDKFSIHPVWMFTGVKGIGKATLAHILAKEIYGNIGDFFLIDIDNNIDKNGILKKDSKIISVYTIRKVIEKLHVSSMSGGWRVVLIDSMDELNNSASNALLKVLEEPPEKTIFFLIVNKLSNVLPTIRSRSRVQKMMPLSKENLKKLCSKFDINLENEDILDISNGSFGKIAKLKETSGDLIYNELIESLKNKKSFNTMSIVKKLNSDIELYDIVLDVIAYFGLSDLYKESLPKINEMINLHLDPEITLFSIINEIQLRLSK